MRVATTTPVTVAAATDCVVVTNLGVAGAVAVNLPAGVTGQMFAIVDGKGDAATNNITITPAAGNINGAGTYVINGDRNGIIIAYNGTEWTILSEFIASGTAGSIPRSQIAAGTASHVVINDGSGLLSSEAQLAITRGGTGQATATAAFDALSPITTRGDLITNNGTNDSRLAVGAANTVLRSDGTDPSWGQVANANIAAGVDAVKIADGSVDNTEFQRLGTAGTAGAGNLVTTDGTQAVTNKDYDGGTASNSSRITLPKAATATLNALTRKEATVVYDTSTGQVKFDNGTTLTALASTATATPTAQGTITSYFPIIQSAVSTVTNADATVTTTDGFLIYAFSTGNTARTLTLAAASANAGRRLLVKKTDSGTGTVTVTRAGSDTIDGATTFVLTSQYDFVEIVCVSSTAWSVAHGSFATTTQSGIVSTTTQSYSGVKTFSSGVQFATSGGTPATLDFYETGTLSVYVRDASGNEAGPFSFSFTRIGNQVTLTLFNGTNATLTTTATTVRLSTTSGSDVWPARLTPARPNRCPVTVVENTVQGAFGNITMQTNFPVIFKDAATNGFSASNVAKGLFENATWTYHLT